MYTYLNDDKNIFLDLLDCLTSHWVDYSDHKLVCAPNGVRNRPRMVGHWMLNTSLLDMEDFRMQLTRLMQWELMGAVVVSVVASIANKLLKLLAPCPTGFVHGFRLWFPNGPPSKY